MLGYTPADTSVVVAEGQEAVVNFQLKAQAIELEAVVAVGYGGKRREDLTGAVGTVSSQALESRPITNTLSALQGALPGLIVQRSGGQPGVEDFDLNLRGVSSANGGNTPLVLIDGVPGNLDLVNPADIESITALKDAAASIYGARAADGALLVTSRRGTRTAPAFTYSNNTGVTTLTGMTDTPNYYQIRLNYDYDFSRRVRLETRLGVENQDRSDIGGFSHGSWCSCPCVIVEGIFGMPNHPIYTESGQHFFAQGGWGNAVAQAKEAATASFATRGVNTNFKLIVEPLDGLKLNLQSGVNYRSDDNTDIGKSFPLYRWDDSSIVYYSIANPDQNWVTRYNGTTLNRSYVGYAEFSRT